MPNPGGPYGGCNACRRRKVKCDQTYPACKRCAKRQIICPGVQDRRTQIFRDETSKTAGKVESRERHCQCPPTEWPHRATTTKKLKTTPTNRTTNAHPTAAIRSARVSTTVPHSHDRRNESFSRPISDPQEELLTAFFFDQMTCPDVGWYAYLPGIYYNAAPDSYLNTSIQAASLFVLANQRLDRSSLMSHARFCYGNALAALNSAIGDENERLKDEVLCTVLILNTIDDITGDRDLFSGAHLSGLQRLLRLRKSLGIKSRFGAEVWHSVAMKSQLLIFQADNMTQSSSQVLIPQMLVSPALMTHETFDAVRKFGNRVGKSLFNSPIYMPGEDSFFYLLLEGKRLDLELQAWTNEEQVLGVRWNRHIAPSFPRPNEDGNIEYFSSIQAAKVWNQNRCARIQLHQTLLGLAEYVASQECWTLATQMLNDLESTVTESKYIIGNMLDCICGSIPFNLHHINSSGRFSADQSQRVVGGVGLVWPLEVVLSCPYSLKRHRTLAIDALREIGHAIGVRQALLVIGE